MTAIERGCPYTIKAGGSTATLNQPSDPNFCGYVTDVTGLDMYGVRENAQQKAAGDGGYHGPFWRDRRPFTVTGFIYPTMPLLVRDQAQDRLVGTVANAFRQDGQLLWTPADGIQRNILFRVQQPVRLTKGQSNVEANYLVAGVAQEWRITSTTKKTVSATLGAGALPLTLNTTNGGNADAAPIFTIRGGINAPIITNTTTGKKFQFLPNIVFGNADVVVIDLTGTYPVILFNGADVSYAVDPINSDYTIAVGQGPGANSWQLSSANNAAPGGVSTTSLQIDWYDSWH